ncbi:MAG: hypothetical protein GYA50_06210 [Eubacteriaceae bacterium]|nr:hypothetical protein [Eubacteriaceae bacterium]
MKEIKLLSDYLHEDVSVTAINDKVFEGTIESYGYELEGEELYDKAQPYIEVYDKKTGLLTVIFEDEIKDIEIL